MAKSVVQLIKEHGITEEDLREEYRNSWSSNYLEECTLNELVDLMINEQVFSLKEEEPKKENLYTEEEVYLAVNYVIGDDGFRATEVISLLRTFLKERGELQWEL